MHIKSGRTQCKFHGFTFRGYIGDDLRCAQKCARSVLYKILRLEAIYAKTSDVCKSSRTQCNVDDFAFRDDICEDLRCRHKCAHAVKFQCFYV